MDSGDKVSAFCAIERFGGEARNPLRKQSGLFA